MRFRDKIAVKLAVSGKSAALGKDDFGDWMGFTQAYGMKRNSGEIPWNDYTAQRQQYKGTTYACIQKIAAAVAAASLHLFIPEGNGEVRKAKRKAVSNEMKSFLLTRPHCKAVMMINEEVEEITRHPALDVFKRANGSMTRFQLFEMSMINMGLNGNNYWEPIDNEAGAYPAMINFLPTDRTKPVTKDGIVVGYEVERGWAKPPRKLKADEVVHFFYPNPHEITEGYSPVAAASQRISSEVNISTVQNSTLLNMGVPPYIVNLLRRMPPERFEEFKQAFNDIHQEITKRGKVGFTDGQYEIHKIGQTLEEMGYIEGAKMAREFIANVLQVPISKLTMESSNRAVAEAGNIEFQRDTILPNLTLFAEELTQSLIPMFPSLEDTSAFYMFENPVPEDVRTMMRQQQVDRTTGVATANEWRKIRGFEPHPSEEADELAPIRASAEQSESMAVEAIDRAVDKAIDDIKNGDCGH
jgi:HK97 family phage portal protein